MSYLTQKRIGEVNHNLHGERMEIIDYINHRNVTIKFEDGSVREHVCYCAFKTGEVRNHMLPNIFGVGISGYEKKKVNDKLIKEYTTWMNILQRCYDEEKQKQFPRYKGCSVCDEWLDYSRFAEWCRSQENWNKVINDPKNFHIDKDIIKKGNLIYCPDYCSFVPAKVNVMFTKQQKMRGDLPIGVSTTKNGTYRSRCSMKIIGEKSTHHTANSPEEAFAYYKKDKERLIREVAKREFAEGNITEKCYKAMLMYEVEITD